MSTGEDPHGNLWTRGVLCGIGTLQGMALHVLTLDQWQEMNDPANLLAIRIFLWAAPILAVLLIRRTDWIRDIVFALVVGLVAALVYKISLEYVGLAYGKSGWPRGASSFVVAFGISFLVILVVPIAFYQAAREERRFAFPYPQLFLNAWTNKLIVLVAIFFLGVNWLVLALWAGLFKLIGVGFFADIFFESWFMSIFSGGAFGLGVALSRERQGTIQALLKLILTLFRVLSPILAGVILLFLAALPVTGLDVLWETKSASRILLSALFLMIIFENAVIQSAGAENSFSKLANLFVMAANCAMLVLALLALWGIHLRVDQYGWTPARLYMAVLAAVGLGYAVTYAGAVIVKRKAWIDGVIWFNPILALGVLAIAVLIHLPPFEPHAVSANDQLARLRDGEIPAARFDFAYLKFKLGNAGTRALTEMANDPALMARSGVAEGRNAANKAEYYRRGERSGPSVAFSDTELRNVTAYMEIFPARSAPSAAAIKTWVNLARWEFRYCRKTTAPRCAIIIVDLNGDGLKDAALLPMSLALKTLLQRADGTWEAGPTLQANKRPKERISRADLIAAIRRGEVRLVPREMQDLMIGEVRFR